MANDGSTRLVPIDPQKLVEERGRVVENQRLILGILGATDVFLEGCWSSMVGVGWGADRNRKAGGRLVVQILPRNGPQWPTSHPITPRFRFGLVRLRSSSPALRVPLRLAHSYCYRKCESSPGQARSVIGNVVQQRE